MGVQAQAAKWKKLKPIETYPGSAYNLKKNIAYMEIRWYKTKKSKKATKTLVLYRKSLKNYPKKVIAKFKSLVPKYSGKANIYPYGNAFFIDTEGKMFQMDMREDIVSLLGEVDTAAEVQLILSLYHEEHGKYYKKIAKGYKVKIVDPLKGCVSSIGFGTVNKLGDYRHDSRNTLLRKGCKKRKQTRFVHSKKVNYEYYDKIALDDKGNLYVLGEARKSKYYASLYLLEKYNNSGKKIWSKKLKGDVYDISVKNRSVYVFGDKKLNVVYSLNGKKRSQKNTNVTRADKKIDHTQYYPEGLPYKKEAIDFHLNDYAKDKKGNVYIVGSEVFYLSGSPYEVPSGECGMVEQVHGALIAKLNTKGETVWAKVIDRDD